MKKIAAVIAFLFLAVSVQAKKHSTSAPTYDLEGTVVLANCASTDTGCAGSTVAHLADGRAVTILGCEGFDENGKDTDEDAPHSMS